MARRGAVTVGGIAVTGVAGVAAAVAVVPRIAAWAGGWMLQTAQISVTRPESFWFTSWMGYLGFFVAICSAAAWFFKGYKFSLEPIERKIADAVELFKKEAKRLEDHFDGEMRHHAQRWDEQLAQFKNTQELKINAFHSRVDHELNGFGRRVEGVEQDFAAATRVISGLTEAMIERRGGERVLLESLARLERAIERQADETRQLNQRLTDYVTKGRP